jgi:hypothetical protein
MLPNGARSPQYMAPGAWREKMADSQAVTGAEDARPTQAPPKTVAAHPASEPPVEGLSTVQDRDRTRPCLGCEGTGRQGGHRCTVECIVGFAPCTWPCPSCLGSGTVTDPDEQPDARVDFLALQVMKDSLGVTTAENRDTYRRFGHGGLLILSVLLALFVGGPASAADVSLLAGPLSSAGLGEQRLSGAVAVEAVSGPFEVALRYDSARKVESGAGWIGTASAAVTLGPARLGGAFVHRDGGVWSKDTFWLEPGAQAGPVTLTLRAAVAGQTEREYGARMRLDLHPRMGAEFQALRHHDGQFGKTAFLFLRVGRVAARGGAR